MARRHIIVIGGTSGSGLALVQQLAQDGNQVSVIGRRDFASEIPGAKLWAADLQDNKKFLTALETIVEQQGKLDALVCCQRFRATGNDWEGELAVTLTATKTAIEFLTGHFKAAGARAIVLIGSNAAQLVGEEQPVSYHTAKAGLKQMARYYAVTLGRQGIRVNLVTPGILIKERSLLYFEENPDLVRLYEEVTPLGRMGTPEDVIGAVKFLISPQAVFITGQDLAVDGGLSLLWQETLTRQVAGRGSPKAARKAAVMNTGSENKEFVKKG